MILTIFFDLGDTLGTAVVVEGELVGFTPFPAAIPILMDLADRAIPLGIISNTGEETRVHLEEILEAAGLRDFFAAELLIFSSEVRLTKADPAIFALAAERAEAPADECLFVGESAPERLVAGQAGFQVCEDIRLVADLLEE
jgi:FMN phosphatase YigB (HAD superfamily)